MVQCGSAGHNVRSKPSMKGTPVGRLSKGNKIEAVEEVGGAGMGMSGAGMGMWVGLAWGVGGAGIGRWLKYSRGECDIWLCLRRISTTTTQRTALL